MEAVREITQWDVGYRQPNHIYLLDGDRIRACINWGEGPVEWLNGRVKLDRRGRKFEPVEISLFDIKEAKSSTISVQGSKGQIYQVDPEAGTCTCPGFTFRGNCKHLKETV